jgi:hypothetical protein
MSRVSAEESVRSPISMIHKETRKGRAEGGWQSMLLHWQFRPWFRPKFHVHIAAYQPSPGPRSAASC